MAHRVALLAAALLCLATADPGPLCPSQQRPLNDTAVAPATIGRIAPRLHAATVPFDDRVVVVGGCTTANCSAMEATALILDPATGAATSVLRLPRPVAGSGTAVVIGRQLIVLGFCALLPPMENATAPGTIERHRTVDVVDLVTGAAVTHVFHSRSRANASCVRHQDAVYLVGGVLLENGPLERSLDIVDFANATAPRLLPDAMAFPVMAMPRHVSAASNTFVTLSHGEGPGDPPWVTISAVQRPAHGPSTCLCIAQCHLPPRVAVAATADATVLTYGDWVLLVDPSGTRVVVLDARPAIGLECLPPAVIPLHPPLPAGAALSFFTTFDLSTATSRLVLLAVGGTVAGAMVGDVVTAALPIGLPGFTLPPGGSLAVDPATAAVTVDFDVAAPSAVAIANASGVAAGCGHGGEKNCLLALATDPECMTLLGSRRVGGGRNAAVRFPIAEALFDGQRLFVCFSFRVSCGQCRPVCGPAANAEPYSVLNQLRPFIVRTPASHHTPVWRRDLYIGIGIAAAVVVGVAAAVVITYFMRRSWAAVGAQDSDYIEVRKIGGGTFGVVHEVRCVATQKTYARKTVNCATFEDLTVAHRECDMLRELKAHPNIIRIVRNTVHYDKRHEPDGASSGALRQAPEDALLEDEATAAAKAPDGQLRIYMELHRQGDLRRWAMDHAGPIPEPVLCHIAWQTLHALDFMQKHSIMHRDLKPENVLVGKRRNTRTHDLTPASPLSVDSDGSRVRCPEPHAAAPTETTDLDDVVSNDSPGGPSLHIPDGAFRAASIGRRGSGSAHDAALSASGYEVSSTASSPVAVGPEEGRLLPVVLTDFGLSHTSAHEDANFFVGTPYFSSPECMDKRSPRPRSTAPVTAKADIWSLGCVLFGVATKRLSRHNAWRMWERVFTRNFERELRRELTVGDAPYSGNFVHFLLLLLRPRPEDRPDAAEAMRYFRWSARRRLLTVEERPFDLPRPRAARTASPEHSPRSGSPQGHHHAGASRGSSRRGSAEHPEPHTPHYSGSTQYE